MPTTCVVYGCRHRSAKAIRENATKISFFRFPKKPPALRNAWIQAVRWKNWEPSETSVLCSEHFAESDIDRTSMFSVRLHHNAIPSIFTHSASHSQKLARMKKQRSTASNAIKITELSSEEINAAKFNSDAVFEISKIEAAGTSNTPTTEDQTSEHHAEVVAVVSLVNENAKETISEMLNNSAENVERILDTKEKGFEKLEVREVLGRNSACDKNQVGNKVLKTSIIRSESDGKNQILREHLIQREFDLKLQLRNLKQKYILVKKKLKISQQRVRRLTKSNNKLSSMNKELKEIERQDDILGHLKTIPGINSQLMQRQLKKISEHQHDPVEYSDEIRRFAKILYGHSASAYKFIRKSFDDCLPHSRTIGKWREAVETTCKVSEVEPPVYENTTCQTILCEIIATEN